MLKVKNETSDSADLYIYGTIIDDEDANWIKCWSDDTDGYQFPQDLRRQLDGLKGKELTLYINSYGGSIAAGVAMANMIKRHDAKTTAIIDGYCCSIATQIFFSANVCKCPSNCWLMVHKPWSIAEGNAEDMRKVADILDTLQKGLEETYCRKKLDKVTAEEIHEMTEKETWLTGKEAAENFQIEVIDSVKATNCVGSIDKLKAMGAKKIPTSLNFLGEEKYSPPPASFDWTEIEITLARAKGVV